jgi:hypothetical protein
VKNFTPNRSMERLVRNPTKRFSNENHNETDGVAPPAAERSQYRPECRALSGQKLILSLRLFALRPGSPTDALLCWWGRDPMPAAATNELHFSAYWKGKKKRNLHSSPASCFL